MVGRSGPVAGVAASSPLALLTLPPPRPRPPPPPRRQRQQQQQQPSYREARSRPGPGQPCIPIPAPPRSPRPSADTHSAAAISLTHTHAPDRGPSCSPDRVGWEVKAGGDSSLQLQLRSLTHSLGGSVGPALSHSQSVRQRRLHRNRPAGRRKHTSVT